MSATVYTQGGSAGELWKKTNGVWANITSEIPDSLFVSHGQAYTTFGDMYPYNIWGASLSDIWFSYSGGTLLHWDGSTWSIYWSEVGAGASGLPDAAEGNNLNGLWGSATNDVYVGYGDSCIYWNGTIWANDASHSAPPGWGSYLNTTWGASASDIIVASINGVVLRGTAGAWVETDTGAGNGVHMQAAWGTDANNVWVVGTGGAIRFWNGTAWAAQSSGVTSDLWGIWGTSASSVWACGAGGEIVFYNGATWSTQFLNATMGIQTIHGISSSEIYAVGMDATGGCILSYDGSGEWTDETPSPQPAIGDILNGLWVGEPQGYSLTAIGFELGVKKGLRKPGSGRVI
jgi:hypothetical protein